MGLVASVLPKRASFNESAGRRMFIHLRSSEEASSANVGEEMLVAPPPGSLPACSRVASVLPSRRARAGGPSFPSGNLGGQGLVRGHDPLAEGGTRSARLPS
jgi:hypothetical protein